MVKVHNHWILIVALQLTGCSAGDLPSNLTMCYRKDSDSSSRNGRTTITEAQEVCDSKMGQSVIPLSKSKHSSPGILLCSNGKEVYALTDTHVGSADETRISIIPLVHRIELRAPLQIRMTGGLIVLTRWKSQSSEALSICVSPADGSIDEVSGYVTPASNLYTAHLKSVTILRQQVIVTKNQSETHISPNGSSEIIVNDDHFGNWRYQNGNRSISGQGINLQYGVLSGFSLQCPTGSFIKHYLKPFDGGETLILYSGKKKEIVQKSILPMRDPFATGLSSGVINQLVNRMLN